jgi:hypothetical protein
MPHDSRVRWSFRAVAALAAAVVLMTPARALRADPTEPAPVSIQEVRDLLQSGKVKKARRAFARAVTGVDDGALQPTPEILALLTEARAVLGAADASKAEDQTRILVCEIRRRLGYQTSLLDGNEGELTTVAPGLLGEPEKLYGSLPDYVIAARSDRFQLLVVTQVVVDQEGCVTSVKYLSGAPYGMERAVIEAQLQWVFRPVQIEGRPRTIQRKLTTSYTLQ